MNTPAWSDFLQVFFPIFCLLLAEVYDCVEIHWNMIV